MSPEWHPPARALILFGLLLIGIGLALLWGSKLPWLGRLPGDLIIRRDHVSFYLPLTSSVLVSALLSLLLWLVGRFRH